jgi:glycerophosphoryl diester phosphodiesterase
MCRPWLRIAHRGASGSVPEHTRPAFEKALAIGVDMIELDVQLSCDGELVVIHDLELGRTTDGSGRVSAPRLP